MSLDPPALNRHGTASPDSAQQFSAVVHTVKGTTSPAHPFGTATGVLTGGRETFAAQTVDIAADGTWSAEIKTPRTPATYQWDWSVTDIDDGKATTSIPVVVTPENPQC